jgi:SAM-dependent methyltransferase
VIRPGGRSQIGLPTLAMLRRALGEVRPAGERPIVDLFRRELTLEPETLARWLPSGAVHELEEAGLIDRSDGWVRALVRLDPVDDLLIASDLNRLHGAADFVVGPGPSSLLLARHVPPRRGGRLLDLGSGSGVQGLIRGDRSTHVTAIDINPRAVAFTRFNAAINGRPCVRAELGDFLGDQPDRRLDGKFDTVIANPPYVLAPAHELTYRDRPLPGDEVSSRTIERVARALAPNGRGYVLCNWIDRGGTWSDPVRAWTAALNRDVKVTLVQSLDALSYAAIWTRGLAPDARTDVTRQWAAALSADGVEQIHVGLIELARPAHPTGALAFEPREAQALTAVS